MERWLTGSRALVGLLSSVFTLLQRAQPDPDEYDVTWHGPHWVRNSRRQRWCPTKFSLYDGQLFGSVRVGIEWHSFVWRIGQRDVRFEGRQSFTMVSTGEPLWTAVLRQVRDRLRRALRDPERYHRGASGIAARTAYPQGEQCGERCKVDEHRIDAHRERDPIGLVAAPVACDAGATSVRRRTHELPSRLHRASPSARRRTNHADR